MIIAFGHRRRVGKDTATNALIDMLAIRGIPAVRVSFADGLKEVCTDIFGWAGLHGPAHYEEFPQEKEEILLDLGLSPRTIWIETGNKLRQVYEDVWIDMALNLPISLNVIVAPVSGVNSRNSQHSMVLTEITSALLSRWMAIPC